MIQYIERIVDGLTILFPVDMPEKLNEDFEQILEGVARSHLSATLTVLSDEDGKISFSPWIQSENLKETHTYGVFLGTKVCYPKVWDADVNRSLLESIADAWRTSGVRLDITERDDGTFGWYISNDQVWKYGRPD